MSALLFKPFTSAAPGSIGELFEVVIFCYCFVSVVFAPILWYAWRGIDDANRLRRYLTLLCVPVVWPVAVAKWGAQAITSYARSHFWREFSELIPKRDPPPVLRSPRDLGLWD